MRANTGSNLRRILLQTKKTKVKQLCLSDWMYLQCHPLPQQETWKVKILEEMIRTKNDDLEVDGFTREELNSLINYLCSNLVIWILPSHLPGGFSRGSPVSTPYRI